MEEGEEMEGIASDKVNIHVGGGSDGGAGSMAAVIAALGNRNQGNDNAALIAALGNRNDDSNNWAPLLAMMGNQRHDGDGMQSMWPILLLLLLRGRGGFGGDGDDCGGGHNPHQAALLQTLLESVGDIRAEIPTTALQTQNALQNAIAQLALGAQQGFANIKDVVQSTAALNLSATNDVGNKVIAQGLTTQIAIGHDGDKTRALIVSQNENNLQRQLTVAQNALLEERFDRRGRDTEINVSQTVNQQQAQAQAQLQLQDIGRSLTALCGQIQVQNARQAQDIVNLGTMVGSASQAAQSTQVR